MKDSENTELGKAKTCELVAELQKREGVEKVLAEPYQLQNLTVEGPAVILIITD